MSLLDNEPLESLKEEWRVLFKVTLPEVAKDQNWAVVLDHCIARIIYDHVAGAKWDTVWQKPAIHNLSEENLKRCISVGNDLAFGRLDPQELNIQSLKYRGKI